MVDLVLEKVDIGDEYTREALAVVVDHSIDADRVVGTLARLAIERGWPPAFVRFDNGPEFVSNSVAGWCVDEGVDSVFIDLIRWGDTGHESLFFPGSDASVQHFEHAST